MRDAVRPAAYEHAPALAERLVDAVDLERDLLVGVTVDRGALAGPDHDRARHHGEVDREHDRARDRAERDPPDAARRDQPAALGRQELGYDGRADQAAVSRWHLDPGAQQGGRRGPQRGGQLAQVGGVWAGPGISPRIPGTAGSSRPGRRPAPWSGAVPRVAGPPACSGHPDRVVTARSVRYALIRCQLPGRWTFWVCSSRSSGSRRRRPGPGRGRRFTSSVLSAVMEALASHNVSLSGAKPGGEWPRTCPAGTLVRRGPRAAPDPATGYGPRQRVTYGTGRARRAP